ncbi:hypothetical protein PHYBLDRAFT_188256 [Phycomyces blakesleeanus NRRL 1555(-)]|uniref:Uncharacterized protein n=1 Tax=Phycomyces blakesleeanus (strain ATCC 8743b / DSM 1359 / FGSC 10004 / NBRC 33097 / NRRL 1555) TaxID=763407 RepID=A0A167L2W0_PHYB8|nr:hypothetical protein PHYBLDRAFT_188256 [Phycomyces blakesleeanus NRRL 1555(-)]OAD69466.1 hypothetical protein PHYBLDRAFT_188256 [Phycomyces blakesleeanus NRRL 1555(-)]|eukprot:XP_018287506.1 hypothetical protein PHYBLDRAFT_188256 [Phycomyces blakesleeanus NRRL 1555(-)]
MYMQLANYGEIQFSLVVGMSLSTFKGTNGFAYDCTRVYKIYWTPSVVLNELQGLVLKREILNTVHILINVNNADDNRVGVVWQNTHFYICRIRVAQFRVLYFSRFAFYFEIATEFY